MKRTVDKNDSFLYLRQVEKKVALKKSKIYELIKIGQFPEPVKIQKMSRWIESEIIEWMESYV